MIIQHVNCIKHSLMVALLVGAGVAANADELIFNGGFESGFSSWTRADQPGSDGTFSIQTGASSPINAFPVPPPPEGNNAAMTDAQGPGTHVLYQDFSIPAGSLAGTLSFSLFINNLAGEFFVPTGTDTLDFSTDPNQQARVDLMPTSADPFSIAASDILLNLYQTDPGDPATAGYFDVSTDVSSVLQAHQGQTLRLRFAEVDNVLFFNLGVDKVTLNTGAPRVPDSASVLMMLPLALLLLASRK